MVSRGEGGRGVEHATRLQKQAQRRLARVSSRRSWNCEGGVGITPGDFTLPCRAPPALCPRASTSPTWSSRWLYPLIPSPVPGQSIPGPPSLPCVFPQELQYSDTVLLGAPGRAPPAPNLELDGAYVRHVQAAEAEARRRREAEAAEAGQAPPVRLLAPLCGVIRVAIR